MADHAPRPIDPEEAQRAQKNWDFFTKASKFAIIGTCAVLLFMALILL